MTESLFLTKYPIHLALSQDAENKPRRGWDENDPKFRHRAVMALFEEIEVAQPRKTGAILFRADYLAGQPPFFLVQSKIPPVHLPEGAETVERKLPVLKPGTPIRFRLAINAIQRKTISKDGKTTTHTTPVPFDCSPSNESADCPRETITPWISRKLASVLKDVEIINHQRELLGTNRAASITVRVDTIDGVATVVDGTALNELITAGVGRAKSYGCGLLSVSALA